MNIGENLDAVGFGKDFLDITPKTWLMKEKIDKLYLIKIKNFSAKDTVKIMRKQATYGENIFKKYLLKNCYLKYTRNSSGSTIKNEQSKMDKISEQKTYWRWYIHGK